MKISDQTELLGSDLKVSKKLHPEDIVIGDDVAVSEVGYQCASFMWCGVDSTVLPPDKVVQLTFYPYGNHEPLIVKSVCLPFVLCEQGDGKYVVYDLRHTQLVRLDPGFASTVRSALKSNDKSTKSKSKSIRSKKKRKKKK